jgi:multidrug efflux system membrane fusion protein
VVAVEARTADLPVHLEGLGSVTPLSTVSVRSRVDGQLMEVLFEEGQEVQQGQLLATIDPRPFQVELTRAEGELARDQALLENARIDLERNRKLYESKNISKQELDTQEALVRQHEGSVKADQGAVENARLQLDYCRIASPIDGRAGLRLVDPGNMIRANDSSALVVIARVRPIAVVFTIPEDNLPLVMPKVSSGERLTVEAHDRGFHRKLAEGVLLAVDNQVDAGTGTVRIKALFPNDDGALFPGQFVNARLLVDVRRGVITLPAAAIGRGPQGTFVFVVQPDRTVTVRPVAGVEIQGDQASMASGVAAGELVVVDGVDRLREGAAVEVKGSEGGAASAREAAPVESSSEKETASPKRGQ